jgi:hypothetical protein
MAEFLIADVFVIKSRDLFVLAGDILDGRIIEGMRVSLPSYGELEIASLEFADMSNRRAYVCLCFRREDAEEMRATIGAVLQGSTINIT